MRWLLISCLVLTHSSSVWAKKPKVQKKHKVSKKNAKASIVELVTSLGSIRVLLFRKKAPITTQNFLRHVRSGHYNGTIFHRVIPRFMIQGGGMTARMVAKPTTKTIRNEANNGLKNEVGTLAMARTGDPHSASAQFFINTAKNTFLNHTSKTQRGWGYCVFAKVIKGMKVVREISGTPTATKSGHRNVPVFPITIRKVFIVR